jgi:hypothetical protein
VPLQARSQQTPSTHAPDAHWPARAQDRPAPSFATQTPPEHQPGGEPAQSPSAVQVPAQVAPAQEYGSQVCCWGAGQRPEPSQAVARVATPPAHAGARHWMDAVG